ncbi:MAG TPA: phosphatase PAP2 family protein [Actinomycetota bacterium]|nr:phosphatase PAP2 family protein [Actinomycetota bacterium]
MICAVPRRAWIRGTGLLAIALAVGVASRSGRGRALDERAFRAVNGGWGPAADRTFRALTELGSIWASAGAAAVLAGAGRRSAAARAFRAAAVTWVAGQGLKRLFARARPYRADPEGVRLLIGRPAASSWPSSHPAVLGAFVWAAAPELALPPAARAALTGLVGAVGLSRVYLGVHYPADVVGGILLGRAVSLLAPGPGPAGG